MAKLGVSVLSEVPLVWRRLLKAKRISEIEAFSLIDKAKYLFLTDCACRSHKGYGKCGYPIHTCLYLGMTINRDGEKISREEAKSLVKEFRQMGLRTQLMMFPHNSWTICSCCDCCCIPLNLQLVEFEEARAIAISEAEPSIHLSSVKTNENLSIKK